MKKYLLALNTAVALVTGSALLGQRAVTLSTTALVKPLTAVPSIDDITGTQTMIVNRSRVLKDKADGEGTRYFSSVSNSGIADKTTEEVERLMTPTAVTPQQKVRTMDIVIDIKRPLFVAATGKVPFMIGTTIIEGKVKNLQVNSYITLGELKITKK
jgi:hypothetical protein